MIVIGSRSRMFIDGGGTPRSMNIRRLCCKGCGKIHHELPDLVVPYKRHCAETIEKIISGDQGAVCCEDSTVGRIRAWWMSLRLYFVSILASLEAKYGVEFGKPWEPKGIVRAVVNAHLWVHTRSAFAPG